LISSTNACASARIDVSVIHLKIVWPHGAVATSAQLITVFATLETPATTQKPGTISAPGFNV